MTQNDPSTLLSTLTQASAVMVAIIGGFLVSRLVSLSSELEGIRRQRHAAKEGLQLLDADYAQAHELRLEASQKKFCDLVLDQLIEHPEVDLAALIEENVPRGSSVLEITPYAEELKDRVDAASRAIQLSLNDNDSSEVTLEDLVARGLKLPEQSEEIMEDVLYEVRKRLPSASRWGSLLVPRIRPAWLYEVEARRFDESLRSELELRGEITARKSELSRLDAEIVRMGTPTGVVSATWVLALLSLFGIVVPVVVMAFGPFSLPVWSKVLLIMSFVVGLVAVLGYVLWYLRLLRAGIQTGTTDTH